MSKVLVACGGSLGHINPGLSFIEKLNQNNKECYLLTTEIDYQRFSIIRNNSFIKEIYKINVKGINRKNIFKMIYTCFKYIRTLFYILSIYKKIKPSLIISTGGYVGGLSVIAARIKRIPYMIHEQNACFGLANKMFYKKAKIVFTSFLMNVPNECLIGNPRMLTARKVKEDVIKPSFNKILVMSGSLGSRKINECMIEYLQTEESKKYDITLVTGNNYYEMVTKKIGEKNKHFKVLPFLDDPITEMAKSNLIISRSGATTLFEIIGTNVAAILIPSPNVTNNHQYHNAMLLEECILEEKELSVETLENKIKKTINSQEITKRLQEYSNYYYEKDTKVDWSSIFEICNKFNH